MSYWDELFTLQPFELFICFFVLALLFYSIALVALNIFSSQYKRDLNSIPIAAFLGVLSTIWALSLGFAAADIWSVNSDASQASAEERSAITRLTGMAAPAVLNNPNLMDDLREYAAAVRHNEWLENANTKPDHRVEKALQSLRITLLEMAKDGTPSTIVSQLLRDFDELQDARNKRLAYGSSSVSGYKWNLVTVLTLVTALVIAVTHADRQSAAKKALVFYIATATFCLWMLGLHVNPYRVNHGIISSGFNLDELVDVQLGVVSGM